MTLGPQPQERAEGLEAKIDLEAIKAKAEASGEPAELGDIIFPTLPGAGAPAPARRRGPAPRGTGLPLGRAKQAGHRNRSRFALKFARRVSRTTCPIC